MTILKYRIQPGKFVKGLQIHTPANSTVLSVVMLPDGPHAYVLAPSMDAPETEPHYFLSAQTGQALPDWIADARYITTLQFMSLKSSTIKIDHVFEITQAQNQMLYSAH